jgi:hypothetical protein
VLRSKVVARGTGKTDPSITLVIILLTLSLHRGRDGVEAQDYGYNFTNSRRRSNSSTKALGEFKSKFEGIDPVFEENLHGPSEEDVEKASTASLDKEESTDSSTLGGSVEEEEAASADKKM